MRSKKEPSLCAKTQGRIANRVCRPRQDLRRTPPAVFGTHLVLYSRVSQKSTLKYQFSPKIPEKREKGSGEALRFSPVDLPKANQGIQIIFGRTPSRGASLAPLGQFTFCACRKFLRPAWRCSSSRRGPWWRRRRRSGYTGPWRRRASPSRWRPSERCSCRSASRGRRTPCRWGSG